MLIPTEKIMDTVISWLTEQQAVYDTVVDQFYEDRSMTFFFGRWQVIPKEDLPSIEVAVTAENIEWFAPRVQQDNTTLELDLTVDNYNVEMAQRLLTRLVSITARILASPPHLRPHITGTNDYLYDSLPGNVSYETAGQGSMRVARLTWQGKRLDYLINSLFFPGYEVPYPLAFPPL